MRELYTFGTLTLRSVGRATLRTLATAAVCRAAVVGAQTTHSSSAGSGTATGGASTAGPAPKTPGSSTAKAAASGVSKWGSPETPLQLATTLRSALTSHTRSGHWGAIVLSLTHGDTLFSTNADSLMGPASTMKVFTSCLSLERFGPDFVFKTPVLRDGSLGADGVLQGNLYLRGVGDPSLSPRFWRAESPMDALAREVVAAGVRHVRGDVVGDASAFDGQLVPDGWKKSYLGESYAARVSALSLDENLVWVVVAPDANGKTASVTLDPATTTIPVQSTVKLVAGSRGSISATKHPDGSIAVRGTIGSHSAPLRYSLVVDDPPLFSTGALRAALEKAGVTIDGSTRVGGIPAGTSFVAAIQSPPLGEIIGQMNQESINIIAEMLFRDAAATPTQQGSAANSLSSLRQFLTEKVGARGNVVDVSDGSGLSELDRVTPRSMVELLHFAHESPWSSTFEASLPVDGESGTLKNRSKGTPARGNLHAKTGTTNTVAALGGFVTARDGELLAFSFIYNGTDRSNAKAAMDQMGATMADFKRAGLIQH